MGKRLWRKHSYMGIENDDPGCIWAFFRILGYHNVKRMLPYNKKQKPPGRTSKRKVKPKQHQICPPYELEENEMKMNYASVNLDIGGVGLVSKKSFKAKVKALLVANGDKSKEINLLQQSQLQVLEHNCKHFSAPTLISLLKASPKPSITNPKRIEEPSNLKPKSTRVEKKDSKEDDQVSVLEVFKVNQDLFFKVMKNSPPRKPRLAKSKTFPSPNPSETMAPTKIEHKHNEVWPVINHGHDLKKSKSRRIARSLSLKESLDTKSNNKEIKKGLSRSFKLANEKEFALLGYHHIRRSSRERLSFLEMESYCEAPHASLERSRLNDTRNFDSLDQVEGLSHLHSGGKSNEPQETEQILQTKTGVKASFQEDQMQKNCCQTQIPQDSLVSQIEGAFEDPKNNTYNEELQYVKYILDLMGFTSGEDPIGAWHSLDQPLDPALFDGIEVCCPFFEPNKSSKKETTAGLSSQHKKILFDLINEALVYVHERSYVVYPKALSYSCHVRPKPNGKNRVVEEVWEFISEYLKWRPEIDPVLDLAVPCELFEQGTGSGWMNLQSDSECLALYLEDLIFDDLLDEIV